MIPDAGITEAIRNVPEANLQERLRAEARRLRSAERATALKTFHSSLFSELSVTITDALNQRNISTALPMLIDSAPLLRASGHLREGESWLSQALQQPEAQEQPNVLLMRGYLALGQIRIALGEFEAALPPLRKSLSSSEKLTDQHASLIVSNHLALTCDKLGNYIEAQVLYQNAIQVAELARQRTTELHPSEFATNEADLCMLHTSLSASYLLSGDFQKASDAALKASSYHKGLTENRAIAAINRATALYCLEGPEAPVTAREALRLARDADAHHIILLANLFIPLLEPDSLLARQSAQNAAHALQEQGIGVPVRMEEVLKSRGLLPV